LRLVTTVSLIRVANLDELRGDGPHALSADGFDIVVVRTPAGLRAFEGRCPHQGALLGEGELDGDTLDCRNHRWRFSVDSGQREGGPQCLASCPVAELKRFTVDVTTLITFGHDVNTVEQGDDVIQRKLELVFPAVGRRLIALFPTWRLVRLPRDRRLDRALAELRVWLGELVVAERAHLVAEPGRAEQPSNFLEAMLSARDDEGRPFSDDVIFGNLMGMLLAGEDTTAYALGWAVHQLSEARSR
jgi:nitrite reductase/ring-hydroxylating ferredoxin subunit